MAFNGNSNLVAALAAVAVAALLITTLTGAASAFSPNGMGAGMHDWGFFGNQSGNFTRSHRSWGHNANGTNQFNGTINSTIIVEARVGVGECQLSYWNSVLGDESGDYAPVAQNISTVQSSLLADNTTLGQFNSSTTLATLASFERTTLQPALFNASVESRWALGQIANASFSNSTQLSMSQLRQELKQAAAQLGSCNAASLNSTGLPYARRSGLGGFGQMPGMGMMGGHRGARRHGFFGQGGFGAGSAPMGMRPPSEWANVTNTSIGYGGNIGPAGMQPPDGWMLPPMGMGGMGKGRWGS
jgi:hypothetical protein